MISLNPDNLTILEKIQSSLLVFCLDDDSPHATPEDYSQVFDYLVLLFLFFFLKNLFVFGCAGSLLLCMGFLSSCGKRDVLSGCCAWASHCGGLSRCGAQALGAWVSVATTYGPDLCPLCWPMGS